MALNPPLSENGNPCRVEGELFIMKRKGVEFQIKVKNGNKYKGKGIVIMTTCRLVLLNSSKKDSPFKAFDIPLALLIKEDFKQPFFGANYIEGTVDPLLNILPGPCEFKIWLMEGGCNTFVNNFFILITGIRRNKNKEADTKLVNSITSGTYAKTAYLDPNDPTTIYLEQPKVSKKPVNPNLNMNSVAENFSSENNRNSNIIPENNQAPFKDFNVKKNNMRDNYPSLDTLYGKNNNNSNNKKDNNKNAKTIQKKIVSNKKLSNSFSKGNLRRKKEISDDIVILDSFQAENNDNDKIEENNMNVIDDKNIIEENKICDENISQNNINDISENENGKKISPYDQAYNQSDEKSEFSFRIEKSNYDEINQNAKDSEEVKSPEQKKKVEKIKIDNKDLIRIKSESESDLDSINESIRFRNVKENEEINNNMNIKGLSNRKKGNDNESENRKVQILPNILQNQSQNISTNNNLNPYNNYIADNKIDFTAKFNNDNFNNQIENNNHNQEINNQINDNENNNDNNNDNQNNNIYNIDQIGGGENYPHSTAKFNIKGNVEIEEKEEDEDSDYSNIDENVNHQVNQNEIYNLNNASHLMRNMRSNDITNRDKKNEKPLKYFYYFGPDVKKGK